MSDAEHTTDEKPDGYELQDNVPSPDREDEQAVCSECGETHEDGACCEEPGQLTGAELLEREEQRRTERKEFVIEYPDGAEAIFEYRMLSEDEADRIEEAHTSVDQRRNREPEVSVDTSALRTDLIMAATTDAPEGFKLTERNIEALSRDVRESFANAIENFSSMDPETREAFR